MVDLLILIEMLLTGYLLFNYKKIIKKYNNKAIGILITILIRNTMNYENISLTTSMLMYFFYNAFIFYLSYIIYKEKKYKNNTKIPNNSITIKTPPNS